MHTFTIYMYQILQINVLLDQVIILGSIIVHFIETTFYIHAHTDILFKMKASDSVRFHIHLSLFEI